MWLDEYVDGLDDREARKRRLAKGKLYAITDYLAGVATPTGPRASTESAELATRLSVGLDRLRRSSQLVAGLQASLSDWTGGR